MVITMSAAGLLPGLVPRAGGQPLTVTVHTSTPDGYAPSQFVLTASVTGGSPPYTLRWTLPDGSSAPGTSITIPLAVPGGYVVRASVSDAAGATASSAQSLVVVSPLPEASTIVPAPTGDPNVGLELGWASSADLTGCVLGGWGSLAVPAFVECASDGGTSHFGTNGSARYTVDPDDPEPTPVLFQATQSGVPIHLEWWYNGTAGTESSGASDLVTAIAPL